MTQNLLSAPKMETAENTSENIELAKEVINNAKQNGMLSQHNYQLIIELIRDTAEGYFVPDSHYNSFGATRWMLDNLVGEWHRRGQQA